MGESGCVGLIEWGSRRQSATSCPARLTPSIREEPQRLLCRNQNRQSPARPAVALEIRIGEAESFSQVVFAFSVTSSLVASGLLWSVVIGLLGGIFPAVGSAGFPIGRRYNAIPAMRFSRDRVLPHLIHLPMRQGTFTEYRRRVVAAAEGRVLEIGIGSGLNLP